MPNQLVKVRRADIVACMTCPLCEKLLVEATTISLCLHTFCRKCIYEKLSDDEYDTCPICDINLGCNPVDKLRPDHNLQDIRAKIFPMKRRTLETPEATPSISLPTKRKERSLSSLVVSTPRVSVHAGATGRRTRASVRKSSATRGSSSSSEEAPSKGEDSAEDNVEGSSSPETLNKIIQNRKLAASSAKSSNDPIPNEDARQSVDGKGNLWKPLTCLVEAANRTKFSKSNSVGPSHIKAESSSAQDAVTRAAEPGLIQNGHRAEARDDTNSLPSVPSPAKRKRLRPNRSAGATSGDSSNSPQLVVDVTRHNRQNMPIWFSLVASEDQEGAAPLPQIASGFLRIKNGDMPVSSIQKYIAKKLELASEDEVHIMLQGQSLLPSLQLRSLLDTWLRSAPASRRIKTSVGSSGKEFMMVLTYSRKAQVQPQPQPQPQPQHQPQPQPEAQAEAQHPPENNGS